MKSLLRLSSFFIITFFIFFSLQLNGYNKSFKVNNLLLDSIDLELNLGLDTFICSNDSILIGPEESIDSLDYLWSTGDTINQLNISEAGIYILTISSDSCSITDTITIEVNPRPNADFVVDSVCFGNNSSFLNLSTNVNEGEAEISWNFGDGFSQSDSIVSSFSYMYDQNNGFSYEVILSIDNLNGCGISTDTQTVVIHKTPNAIIEAPTEICSSEDLIITNQSIDTINPTFSLFEFNQAVFYPIFDSTVIESPDSGFYDFQFIVSNVFECSDTFNFNTIVEQSPIVSISANQVCFGTPTTLTNTSSFLDNATLSWSFGDGEISDTDDIVFNHLYPENGVTYTTSLSIDNNNGCTDSESLNVIILLEPSAAVNITSACLFEEVISTNNSINLSNTATTTYIWGDGSEETDFTNGITSYLYDAPNEYTITVIVDNMNGCIDSLETSTEIFPLPDVSFSGLDILDFCIGDPEIQLTGSPLGGTFDGLNVSNIPNQPGLGSFNPMTVAMNSEVRYSFTDMNGCMNIDTQLVLNVFPLPNLMIEGLELTYCQFDTPDTIQAFPLGGNFEINPDFITILDESEAIFNPNFPSQSIEIIYSYTDSNNCSNTIIAETQVFEIPDADLGEDLEIPPGTSVEIGPNTVSSSNNYLWSNSATTPSIIVFNPGFYTLLVTNASNGCFAADTILVDFSSSLKNLNIKEKLNLFPNITTGVINVELNQLSLSTTASFKDDYLTIISSNGLVLSKKLLTTILDSRILDLSSFSKGIYWIRIRNSYWKVIKI